MSGEMLIIRFPDGDAELYAGSRAPAVGDTLVRRGATFVVASVDWRADDRVRVMLEARRPT